MTSERECFVYIMLPNETTFVTAARFRVSKNRQGNFVGEIIYGKQYLKNPNAVELDPIELVLSTNKYETAQMQGFFGAIRDAMPDYWGRRVIERHVHKPNLDEFDYLMYGPDDRAGALGFGFNAIPPSPRRDFSRTLELETLQSLSEAILNNQPIEAIETSKIGQVNELLLEATSMGGARPKAVIEDEKCLWIAKFSTSQDRWNYPRVEHAFLNLAKACGLNVADSKLVTVAGKNVLLVRRFDREYTQMGYHRHRMVSALTLLRSDDTYSAKSDWSYLLLADEIRRVSANPKEDLRELYSRMCFNALVSNLDDHPRNHAILAKGTSWRLSPAYDLTPTPSISLENRDLAMSCGRYGRMGNQTNLLSGHSRFLLERDEALLIINSLINALKANWERCLSRAGVNQNDTESIASALIYPGFFIVS